MWRKRLNLISISVIYAPLRYKVILSFCGFLHNSHKTFVQNGPSPSANRASSTPGNVKKPKRGKTMKPDEVKGMVEKNMQREISRKQLEATEKQIDTINLLNNTVKELNASVRALENRNYNQLQQFSNQMKYMVSF